MIGTITNLNLWENNMDNPAFGAATAYRLGYTQGVHSFTSPKEKDLLRCPYQKEGVLANSWQKGYDLAVFEHKASKIFHMEMF